MIIKIGSMWVAFTENEEEIYIFAQTGRNEFALIGLDSGNRWKDPVRIENGFMRNGQGLNLTDEEWNEIAIGECPITWHEVDYSKPWMFNSWKIKKQIYTVLDPVGHKNILGKKLLTVSNIPVKQITQ